MVSVPVVDLRRRAARFADDFAEVVARVCDSGQFLLGAELAGFESEFAAWADVAHVVGTSSGASAIQLSLAALDVGPGDEVLVPAFTAVPTAAAVCAVGATPVFVDVDPATAAVAPHAWHAARTAATKAVIVVHLYGRCAELPEIDLPVIEDAAQAHGALNDRDRRSTGIATAYSFYPTKNLGGIGDGGAIATNDADLAARIRRLRVHAMTEQYVHVEPSQNFRMSELEAGWLRLGLPQLAADIAARRQIVDQYRRAAPTLRWHDDTAAHVYHLAVIRRRDRDEARNFLSEQGVSTGVHYPLALTQQPGYRHLTTTPCPAAEAWAAECISVPCFPEMTHEEIDRVAGALVRLAGRPEGR